jgi:pimeloyl-ACP methyl ester carboxylesterase
MLADLGWAVDYVNLLGHGGRALGKATTVRELADDVLDQRPDGADLVVGHSLGGYVALELVGTYPGFARGVLLEDPPSMSAEVPADIVAASIFESVRRSHADPESERVIALTSNPGWDERDAEALVDGRLKLDPAVARLSGAGATRDLLGLAAAAGVPVALLAAEVGSMLADPVRAELIGKLPSKRVVTLASGHAVHRDRPFEWVEFVNTFGRSLGM